MHDADIAAAILRFTVGTTIILHGWNHAFGGGRLAGTASWFDSIGIRPGRVHALVATLTEVGAGVLLLLGFLTPLAAGAVLGTMVVALIAAHRTNGFFIFSPGQGYEYVLMIGFVCAGLGSLGGGRYSVDNLIGFDLSGAGGLLAALAIGLGGSGLLLATCWRPTRVVEPNAEPNAESTAVTA